ncbi:MAG TPA: ATP-binding cassette domain-containing protein [Sphingobium sp.]|nr:ATP-binding cassette domain-containing protein [Sphingobium sp.]
MIRLESVTKDYTTRQGKTRILSDINLVMQPGEKIGILGSNGSGKSTLIRLISGAENPTSGRIVRTMTTSWPLAFSGGFQTALTGVDNLRFICRIYGVSTEDKIGLVEEFAELGPYLREPVRMYSSGMRARLAFAISMIIEFDCFLIDEVVAVGDSRFREKCEEELFKKRGDRAMIIVSHNAGYVRKHCDRAAVLNHGVLRHFSDVEGAYQYYDELMKKK